MKSNPLFRVFLFVLAGIWLTLSVSAQGPSGSITSPTFAGAGEGLYDVTGVITNFSEDFDTPGGGVTVSGSVDIRQSATGGLTAGTPTAVVTVTSATDNFPAFTFTGTDTLKGGIKSSGNNLLMSVAFSVKGNATDGNGTHQYTESLTYLVLIDPHSPEQMTITKSGAVTKSGTNGGAGKLLKSTTVVPTPPGFAPVNWHLNLSVATSGAKVTGTATVQLANERSFPFTVKGTTKGGASKLTLTGTGTGKGVTLQVTLAGNTITKITGKLLGQTLNLSVSAP